MQRIFVTSTHRKSWHGCTIWYCVCQFEYEPWLKEQNNYWWEFSLCRKHQWIRWFSGRRVPLIGLHAVTQWSHLDAEVLLQFMFVALKSWASPTVYISKLRRSEGDILTFTHLKTKRSSLHNNSLRDYNNFIMSNGQIDYSRSFVAHFRF